MDETDTRTESTQAPQASIGQDTAAPRAARPRITKRKAVEQVARSYFDALARRDPDAMAEHWTEDGVEEILPVGILRGPAAIKQFFSDTLAAVPDSEFVVTRLVAGEREVAVEWRMRGTFSGERFQGLDANGREVEVRGLDLLEIENGKIASNTAYYDGMAFARQVGLMPPQDSGAERAMKNAFNASTKLRQAVRQRMSR
ncbi:MAG TPA: ester cyclase [Thermoleophilaceae bacterium]|nr:ester cyclase [Thermoleophilaceae bacterium]